MQFDPRILGFYLAATCVAVPVVARASSGPDEVFLADSIVEVAPSAGPAVRSRAAVARPGLSAAETAASMEIEIALRMRNFDELQARIVKGEVIPADEVAAKYLPLPADYEAVAQWITGRGLKITHADPTRLALFVQGSVGEISQALDVTFARVAAEGEEYTSAVSAPAVSSAVAPVVLGIDGLQPHLRLRTPPRAQALHPQASTGAGVPYMPGQILNAYNGTNLSVSGAGQTIAIILHTYPSLTDLSAFWNLSGVSQSSGNVALVPVGTGPAATDDGEAALDAEWSGAIAPGAHIRFYGLSALTFSQTQLALLQIYNDLPSFPSIHQVSMSFGADELNMSTATVQSTSQDLALLASAGVTVLVASGDGGSNPTYDSTSGTWNCTYPSGKTQVGFPASDPNVTAVGGTVLSLGSDGGVSTEEAWSQGSGGVSVLKSRPVWQTGPGVPAGTMRCVPDVAAAGSVESGAEVIYNGSLVQVGGTSWSAPMWAGFCALINEARAGASLPPLGALNPKIYPLIGTNAFWDILTGCNGAYHAGVGFDPCSGIGVPNLANLIQSLAGPPSSATLPVIVSRPASREAVVGSDALIAVTAAGAAPLSCRWQRLAAGGSTWSSLSDSGSYRGTGTTALSIPAATPAMNGDQFRCVLTNALGSVTGPPTALLISTPAAVTTLAGSPNVSGNRDGAGGLALFHMPLGVATDAAGSVYVGDFNGNVIRKVTPAGLVTTFAGNPALSGSADGAGIVAQFSLPSGVAVDAAGTVYVADDGNDTIRKITPDGVGSTLAGLAGVGGNADGTGSAARFCAPRGVAVDAAGNVYVCDTGNNTIRKIMPGGVVSTLAGIGFRGSCDGQGCAAGFNQPRSIAVDSSGTLYVTDTYNDAIRMITPAGSVTTLAGLSGSCGTADGIGSTARFAYPYGIAIDRAGNLYVAEEANAQVRMIAPGGIVSTIAGFTNSEIEADGLGQQAQFNLPMGIAIDPAGVLYVADGDGCTIRRVVPLSLPQVANPPPSQSVVAGQYVVLAASATGGNLSYQWQRNGVAISGATGPAFTVPAAQAADSGGYSVIISNAVGSADVSAGTLTVLPAGSAASRLVNLSARAFAGTGSSNLVVGFSISGAGAKQLLIRGVGPCLSQFQICGPLATPQLDLFDCHSTQVACDTSWGGGAALANAFAQAYAFPLPSGSADSAMLQSLTAGASTAQVSGLGGTTGVALAEVYELDSCSAAARLINLSSRTFVGTGSNAPVAGFVVSGQTSETVLIRAVGPGLGNYGVTGVLATPQLTLYDATGRIVASNTGWANSAALASVFSRVYAFPLSPDSADCALVATLTPGSYTAQVTGLNATTGVALMELYDVP